MKNSVSTGESARGQCGCRRRQMDEVYKRYLAQDSGDVTSFVEAICLRPKMYTLAGTLEEIFCFINGFYSGLV
jgi:hypothetical protein